jgi:ribosomal protein S18 acetylase RimI-like enzyme
MAQGNERQRPRRALVKQLSIRPMGEGDFRTLAEMYYDFHQFHVAGVPAHLCSLGRRDEWDREPFYDILRKILAADNATIWLAEFAGQVVGLMEVYVRQDEEDPAVVAHRYMELQSLLVLEPFRRRGVANRLLEFAIAWARPKGATEIRLSLWEFNAGARAFYEALGFRTLQRRMLLEV